MKPTTGGRHAPPPKQSRIAHAIPFTVTALTLAVVAWSAWPVIRPTRSVTVTQAVFQRTTEPTPDVADDEPTARSTKTVQAAGWLEAEPYLIACSALTDGVVESLEVLEGDWVDQGQIVAHLVREDSELRLRIAEARLAAAQSEVALAEAERAAAQAAWDEPVELERAVEAGRASLSEAEGALAQLPSLIQAARATESKRVEELARAQESRSNGAASELEVIVARQDLETQRAESAALVASEPILRARVDRFAAELRAAERDLALRIADRRRLDGAQATLLKARAAAMQAEAARDEAALELDRTVIRAPVSGYVQRRVKAPGDKAVRMMDDPHSAHIVHLYDPQHLQVRVDVPLADAAGIAVGQRCEVVVEVLPDRVFAGEVIIITHEADLQKNTLQVKVRVTDPDPILRPEMLTRVKFLGGAAKSSRIQGDEHASSVLLPADAIDHRAGNPSVWLVTDRQNTRGVLRSVPVTTSPNEDGWITVSGSIQPGALVAMPDQNNRDGEPVRFNATEGGAS